jgi:hypothetical protein
MRHLQIVKEHINVGCLIADVNIQITILTQRNSCLGMCCKSIAAINLFKAAATAHIFKLLIKQYPVNKCFGFAGGISAMAV